MKPFYSVEEVQNILLKNKETILRYIRNSIIKDTNTIELLLDRNIITTNDIINGTAYLSLSALEALHKENLNPSKGDSPKLLEEKKILKKVSTSLILEKPNTKPYFISAKSILLLLVNRFNKNEAEAVKLLDESTNEEPGYPSMVLPNPLDISIPKTAENIGCVHGSAPDLCVFCQKFDSAEIKEKFIKGLYLLECIDGEISDKEKAMISDRASRLGITEEQIRKLAPDTEKLDSDSINQMIDSIIPLVKFRDYEQRVVFIKEAILLAYQDGCYTDKEKWLIGEYAKINDIPSQIVQEFDEEIKEIVLRNIGKQYVISL